MRSLGLVTALAVLLLTSCSTARVIPILGLDFFVPAGPEDPWNSKIQNWQARHHLDPAVRGDHLEDVSELGTEWSAFELEVRREVAANTMSWVQKRSREHYRADGTRDHWATLGEVIESGEDDCDGLDLLTFVLLRRLGFDEDQIYRAIVVEDGTGQHHMVTLWFEDEAREDPYVLDPTGVVTSTMVRLSEVPDWEPIELFDERQHYAVRPTTRTTIVASE